jgi:hypothetical protein
VSDIKNGAPLYSHTNGAWVQDGVRDNKVHVRQEEPWTPEAIEAARRRQSGEAEWGSLLDAMDDLRGRWPLDERDHSPLLNPREDDPWVRWTNEEGIV